MDAVTLLWLRFGCNSLEIPAIAILTQMSVFTTRFPGFPQPLLCPPALLHWISDVLSPHSRLSFDLFPLISRLLLACRSPGLPLPPRISPLTPQPLILHLRPSQHLQPHDVILSRPLPAGLPKKTTSHPHRRTFQFRRHTTGNVLRISFDVLIVH
jgi:hypothetical protein